MKRLVLQVVHSHKTYKKCKGGYSTHMASQTYDLGENWKLLQHFVMTPRDTVMRLLKKQIVAAWEGRKTTMIDRCYETRFQSFTVNVSALSI